MYGLILIFIGILAGHSTYAGQCEERGGVIDFNGLCHCEGQGHFDPTQQFCIEDPKHPHTGLIVNHITAQAKIYKQPPGNDPIVLDAVQVTNRTHSIATLTVPVSPACDQSIRQSGSATRPDHGQSVVTPRPFANDQLIKRTDIADCNEVKHQDPIFKDRDESQMIRAWVEQQLNLAPHDVQIEPVIENGGYVNQGIWFVKDSKNNKQYYIKKIRKHDDCDEFKLMWDLNKSHFVRPDCYLFHNENLNPDLFPSIPKLIDFGSINKACYGLMEAAIGTKGEKVLENLEKFTEKDQKNLLYQIGYQIGSMQSLDATFNEGKGNIFVWTHLDLNSGNWFFDSDRNKLTIIDFGGGFQKMKFFTIKPMHYRFYDEYLKGYAEASFKYITVPEHRKRWAEEVLSKLEEDCIYILTTYAHLSKETAKSNCEKAVSERPQSVKAQTIFGSE